MDVADIAYFGALASAALVSAVILLRQFLRGDFAEPDATVPRHEATPVRHADPARMHRPRAA